MLITPEYVKEQQRLHEDPAYGSGSHRHAYLVAGIARLERCSTILDYGCGKGTIGNLLRDSGHKISEYDPGVPAKSARPQPAELVICLDVMEHIEPPCFDAVMDDLAKLSIKRLFVDIALKFTKSRWLSDGRNSHLIVNDEQWWQKEFEKRGFKIFRTWNTGVKAWVALMKPPKK